MMTPNDCTGQGREKRYIFNPKGWRDYDPDVFDYLKKQVVSGSPDMRSIQRKGSVLRCRFYWKHFPQDRVNREHYFDGCLSMAAGTALVFLDPDTGPEPDRLNENQLDKYVLWDEITRVFRAGHSVMVFNFLPRDARQRENLISQRIECLQDRLPNAHVTALRTNDLAFYFAVHEEHWNAVERARTAILKQWKDLPLSLTPICSAKPHPQTFGELLLEIPQDDQEFERLPMPNRPLDL